MGLLSKTFEKYVESTAKRDDAYSVSMSRIMISSLFLIRIYREK